MMKQTEMLDLPSANVRPGLDAVQLILPVPPTVNHYWGKRVIMAKGGKKPFISEYLTTRAKDYRDIVSRIVLRDGIKQIEGFVRLEMLFFPPDRRRRDLSNIYKCIEDSLEHAGVLSDDYQIAEHKCRREREIVEGGMVKVRLLPMVW